MSAAWLAPWQHRPRKAPPRPVPPAPVLPDGLLAEFDNMPLGGWAGEVAINPLSPPPGTPEPAITWDAGLVVEPPDWPEDQLPNPLGSSPDPAPPDAVAEMMAGDFDPEPWQPPAPAWEPVMPVPIPPPDWRSEEP